MAELRELTQTAGGVVVGEEVQARSQVDPAYFIGAGKAEQLKQLRSELGIDLFICNDDLSPRQQRNLEQLVRARVVDRTELILDIFAQHARTREGRLQVEVAQLHHLLPRLIGAWDYHRQGGGIGTRGGPGEQQIEVERRRIRRRLRDLEQELEQVRVQRDQQRKSRRLVDLLTVAIVGYTNAGKSTLINRLTGAGVIAEDRLFATLDPTTRRLRLPGGKEVLVTDTVGFIQNLPTDLVAAFRATLEEVTHADVILQVVDATSLTTTTQADTVDTILEQLEAGEKPRVIALNKIDALGPATLARVVRAFTERYRVVVPISALTGAGLERLGDAIEAATLPDLAEVTLLVPYGREGVLTALRQLGRVEDTQYTETGTRARGWLPRSLIHQFHRYVVNE